MLQEPIKAMRWLQKIMKCRIEFVEQNINQALIGTHNSICTEALTKLEVCLIMLQFKPFLPSAFQKFVLK